MLRRELCIACGAREFRPLFSCVDHLVTRQTFGVAECARCGLRATDPFPSEDAIARYYESDDYVPMTDSSNGAIDRLYHAARWAALRLKRRLVRAASGRDRGRLLDIGCGVGEFPAHLARAGWQVVAVEPHAGARELARRHAGLRVEEAIPAEAEGRFDVVTLWHVLEHLHDPAAMLDRVRDLLAPGGILIAACPNHRCPDGDYYQADWYAYDVPRHLWHFSAATLTALLARQRFALRSLHTLPFDPFYIALLSARHGRRGSALGALRVATGSLLAGMRDPARATAIVYVAAPS
jgi:SAM-dependent methyltransferase